MIISASRRTDIPAYYSEWFMNRVREGFCASINPFNANQIKEVKLTPNEACPIVFWTKNAEPMLKYIDELNALNYKYYFQYTLNTYNENFEPNLPSVSDRVRIFRKLSEKINKQKVIWRYDPIIFSNITDCRYHIKSLKYLFKFLSGYTERLVISFVDDYNNSLRRFNQLSSDKNIVLNKDEFNSPYFLELINTIKELSEINDIKVFTCAESLDKIKEKSGLDLNDYNIKEGKCIDALYIREIFGIEISDVKDKNQRKECGCTVSKDIGMYNTCGAECIYCYATFNKKITDKNRDKHDPDSQVLIGNVKLLKDEKADTLKLF